MNFENGVVNIGNWDVEVVLMKISICGIRAVIMMGIINENDDY
jgi:hypothetical protein